MFSSNKKKTCVKKKAIIQRREPMSTSALFEMGMFLLGIILGVIRQLLAIFPILPLNHFHTIH